MKKIKKLKNSLVHLCKCLKKELYINDNNISKNNKTQRLFNYDYLPGTILSTLHT